MAEQKTEDTKPAAARRGARPFIGPAAGAPAARPFLKPAALPARHAPFVPPLAPDRGTLGTPRREPSAAEPPMPTLHPTISAPAFDITAAGAAPAESVVSAMQDVSAFAAAEAVATPAALPVNDTDFGFPSVSAVEETVVMSAPEPDWAPPVETRNPRSITSEMVAIDAFAAFDSVWGPSNTPVGTPTVAAAPSHVDEEALGCGADGHHAWAEDITAGNDGEAPAAIDAESTPEADPMGTQWTPGSTAAIAMPSWLADDADDIVTSAAVSEAVPPDVADAVEAFASVAETLGADEGTPDATPQARLAALDETPAVADVVADTTVTIEIEGPPVLVHAAAPDVCVVAALDRLAERVRAGEIDVSSVAPDAPDAAVLASVLAALLGGSRSR